KSTDELGITCARVRESTGARRCLWKGCLPMSIAVSRLLRLGLAVAVACVLAAGVAFAGTVTTPSSSPFTVPGDVGANPLPFTVVASGYTPGVNVLITQCDGLDPTDSNWSVAID